MLSFVFIGVCSLFVIFGSLIIL